MKRTETEARIPHPALIFDIDGTLYDSYTHTLSSLAMEQIDRLQKQGYSIGIATSRSWLELSHLPKSFRDFAFDFMILDGGALILGKDHSILKEEYMNSDQVRALIQECERQKILIRYSSEDGTWFALRPKPQDRALMNHFYLLSPDWKPFRNQKVYNLLLWTDKPDKTLESLLKPFRIVHYQGALELTASNTSKGSALRWLKEQGIVRKSVVFGDGENDIELFEQADLAVAPANGSLAALEKADLVLKSWNEEGIGTFLESLE